ncbi:hypothetical protein SELMODRAFT_420405 [Selaginella moellendorffii]|uniref:Uncharacterized protein n=1 Tax=Selaginella moellendorffii TaxID=88036 RepID=D8SBW5_SELML|nr:hypothetical protein SELMODRAFT_420405 [Selaginella moellendorffii]
MEECKPLIEAGLSILKFSEEEVNVEGSKGGPTALAKNKLVTVPSKSKSTQAFKIFVWDSSYYPGKVVAVHGPHPNFGSGQSGIGRAFHLRINDNIWLEQSQNWK